MRRPKGSEAFSRGQIAQVMVRSRQYLVAVQGLVGIALALIIVLAASGPFDAIEALVTR